MMGPLKAFGLFWWDFLAGDAPELAFGVLLILGIVFLSRSMGVGTLVLIVCGVVLLLTVSSVRGRGK